MASHSFKKSYIKLVQPIGDLYMVSLKASDVIHISNSNTRDAYNTTGIQRRLEPSRVSNIAKFCQSKDAMFPTPVILSASSELFDFDHENHSLEFSAPEEGQYFSIVDGQHRLAGIEKSGKAEEFDLLIAFIFDTDASQDAHLFSIINGNQKPVSKSLIYDLYGLSDKRTVEKVCNKIIRFLNNDDRSKMKGMIKLLGYKDDLSPNGTVSQATMMEGLVSTISKNPQQDNLDIEFSREIEDLDSSRYIYREYFNEGNDTIILNHVLTFFNCWVSAISDAKTNHEIYDFYLFEKSIGFATSFQILRILYNEYLSTPSAAEGTLTSFYTQRLSSIFNKFLDDNLNSNTYSSSKSGVTHLVSDLARIGISTGAISEASLRKSLSSIAVNKIIEDQKIFKNKSDS